MSREAKRAVVIWLFAVAVVFVFGANRLNSRFEAFSSETIPNSFSCDRERSIGRGGASLGPRFDDECANEYRGNRGGAIGAFVVGGGLLLLPIGFHLITNHRLRVVEGRSLAAPSVNAPREAPDWSELHTVLAAIPTDRWTTSDDVATVLGVPTRAISEHIVTCDSCRALIANGESRQEREPIVGRLRTQQRTYEPDRLSADHATHLGPRELEELLD